MKPGASSLKKIHKFDNPLARFIRKKKRKDSNKITNERRKNNQHHRNTTIIRHYEKVYTKN